MLIVGSGSCLLCLAHGWMSGRAGNCSAPEIQKCKIIQAIPNEINDYRDNNAQI